MDDNDRRLISELPNTEYGRALERCLNEEINVIEQQEISGLKICDSPLHEDFRWKLGEKAALKRVLEKPKKCFSELQARG